MLIILAIGLFIAEAFITSHGVLGIGGTIAMVIGSVMLIESPSPYLRISWAVIIPVVALSALLFIITVSHSLCGSSVKKPIREKKACSGSRVKPRRTFMRMARCSCAENTGMPGAMNQSKRENG